MAYTPVTWVYKDPCSVQKFTQMGLNSVWTSEHKVIGCEISIAGTSTVNLKPGKLELDGKWLTRDDAITALTAETAGDWEEGASQEGSSTAMYIVAWNDSGNSFNVKFRNSGPAYSDTHSGILGTKQYDKTGSIWYKYLGGVLNDDDQALVKYTQYGKKVFYHAAASATALQIISKGSATTFTTATAYPAVPRNLSTMATLEVSFNNVLDYRIAGTSGTPGWRWDNGGSTYFYALTDLPLSTGQEFEWKKSAGTDTLTVYVAGYTLNNRGD